MITEFSTAWLSAEQLFAVTFLTFAVYFIWRENQKFAELYATAGPTLLEVRRPLLHSYETWCSLFSSGMIIFLAGTPDAVPDASRMETFGRVALVIAALVATVQMLRAIHRGDRVVIARFCENGLCHFINPPFVHWSEIDRWTWTKTPDHQLNLFAQRNVYSIPIKDEVTRQQADELLRTYVGPKLSADLQEAGK